MGVIRGTCAVWLGKIKLANSVPHCEDDSERKNALPDQIMTSSKSYANKGSRILIEQNIRLSDVTK